MINTHAKQRFIKRHGVIKFKFLVMLYHADIPMYIIAKTVDLSRNTVSYWVREFYD